MEELLIEMKDISKSFPGARVLSGVNFSLVAGEIHALMGENGAGKSTLMKILGGIYSRDDGSLFVKGKECDITSPRMARELGIAMIHQELNMIPELSVAENMFMGREITYGRTGWVNRAAMRRQSAAYLTELGIDISPQTIVKDLSVGQQQMVEIAKALSMRADILVLDEPTAALTERESESLFQVIHSLRGKGVGMVYISHRMEEIFQICDRVTVLRDGVSIDTKEIRETSMEELVKMMVGREIKERFPKINIPIGPERLRVKGLTQVGVLHDISFQVHSGEILGVAGLMGAGRSEVAKALFGAEPRDRGEIWLDGKLVTIKGPIDAIQAGIALVTEDRKGEGLILSQSIQGNLALPNLKRVSSYGWVSGAVEKKLSDQTIKQLQIKASSAEQIVGTLSGGNQQKVVIGKWLATKPNVLILDEPTRGVDVGAKKEIYDLMNQLVQEGVAIIMISSELPEILGMSDRILVMSEGRVVGHFNREEATQELVMEAASGGGEVHAS